MPYKSQISRSIQLELLNKPVIEINGSNSQVLVTIRNL